MQGDTEQEIFQEAIAPEPPEPAEGAKPAADPGPKPDGSGRLHDPASGKFVPKGSDGEKPADQLSRDKSPDSLSPDLSPQPSGGDHRVPLSEHLSERERRQTAERERDEARRSYEMLARRLDQLERPREQPKAPDPWVDPSAHATFVARQQVDPLIQQQERQRDDFSRMLAEEKHGTAVVEAAFAALEMAVQRDPYMRLEASRIWNARHPYGALIDWHKNQLALKEIGGDPAAYKTKLRDELLKDPEFRKAVIEAIKAETTQPAQNGSRPRTVTQLPPSLNRVSSAAPVHPLGEEDVSDAELFREATRR